MQIPDLSIPFVHQVYEIIVMDFQIVVFLLVSLQKSIQPIDLWTNLPYLLQRALIFFLNHSCNLLRIFSPDIIYLRVMSVIPGSIDPFQLGSQGLHLSPQSIIFFSERLHLLRKPSQSFDFWREEGHFIFIFGKLPMKSVDISNSSLQIMVFFF